MKTNIRFAWSPIALAVAGAFAQIAYAADELAEFTRPDSEVSIGVSRTHRDAPFFGQFTGLDEQGAQVSVSADLVERDDAEGTWREFHARNTEVDKGNVRFLFQRPWL